MNASTVKVVAFDCDGVLFDSLAANQAYYNHILQACDLPAMTAEQWAFAHMHTVHETLAFLVPDAALLEKAHACRKRMTYLPFIRYMVIEPHLRDLLARLRPARKTAIATNRTNTMQRVIQEHGLEGTFDLVVTASDVTHPKPHPEQLLVIQEYFGVRPTDMIFIGDSELDAAAASAAQVPFVAYGNPLLPADHHIASLADIKGLLGI